MRCRRLTVLLTLAAGFALAIQWRLRGFRPTRLTQAPDRSTAEAPCDSNGSESRTPYKIYVYDLPAKYNTDIAQCFEENNKTQHCQRVGSCGYGPLIAQQQPQHSLQVRNTWQFALEVILHNRMLASPYRTQHASEAHAFYLPYYSGLDCLCAARQRHNVDSVLEWLKKQQAFREGRPHVMALSKIEREHFSQRCSLLAQPEIRDFMLIGIEQEPNEGYRRHRRGNVRPLIVAPYPSYGHFSSQHHHTLNQSRDIFLLLAAGTRRSNPFRSQILNQFPESTTLTHDEFNRGPPPNAVWYQTQECRGQHHRHTLAWMQRSVFCLQPPGDSPTRKSFYDAVVSGCIPVIFKEEGRRVRYPFDAKLNYSAFCVELDASAMQHRTALAALRELSEERIARTQQALQTVAPLLQYSFPFHHSPSDAFMMILNQIADELRLQPANAGAAQPPGK